MKNLKKYFLPLLLVLLIIYALFFHNQKSTLKKSERNIGFAEQPQTAYIEIINASDTATLYRSNDKWFAEDSTELNKHQVAELFNLLENIQIQSSIPKNLLEEYKTKIEQSGTSVRLYSTKKLLSEYRFASIDNKNILKTKNKLHYFSIRGYGEALLSNYAKTDIKQWYDKVLIDLNPKEIMHLLVQYPQHPNKGFIIQNTTPEPIVLTEQNTVLKNTDTRTIKDYLSFYSGITYSYIDTIANTVNPSEHLFRLEIKTNNDRLFHIEGYKLINLTSGKADLVHFAAIVNNTMAISLNYSDFDPILVEQDYFLKSY
jgi:hypothetical protein